LGLHSFDFPAAASKRLSVKVTGVTALPHGQQFDHDPLRDMR